MTSRPEPPAWAAALGRIPSGLFVLTVAHAGRETGMLASWVQQCSFDPPMVSVSIRGGRYVLDWLADGAAFAVSVIGEGQKNLVAHFGKGFGPDEPAFQGLEMDRSGPVPVPASAVAHLHLTPVGRFDAGDHVIVTARVVGGSAHKEGRPTVHVRKSGLHY